VVVKLFLVHWVFVDELIVVELVVVVEHYHHQSLYEVFHHYFHQVDSAMLILAKVVLEFLLDLFL
jgi:hypothetical protein